ncbi:MAG: HAD family hydrolase [Promethearchaeota archaeon]
MANHENDSRLVIFDMDGCILDSFTFFMDLLPQVFEKFDINITQEFQDELRAEIIDLLSGNSSKILILKLVFHAAKRMGLNFIQRVKFLKYLRKMFKDNIDDVPLIPGVVDVFRELKGKGYSVAIFTSESTKAFKRYFSERDDVMQYVDGVVTRDQLKKSKPDPEGIFLLMDRLGVEDAGNVVMVGDMSHDVEAGKAAGTKTVAVLTGVGTEKELEEAGATTIIDSVKDLLPVLDGIL